jgi:hypothetical protein
MYTKALTVGIVALILLVLGATTYVSFFRDGAGEDDDIQTAVSYKDATYMIQGTPVTLTHGVSEVESAPGSATKIVTKYFGNELVKDVNGDGKDDVTFLVTQETGGSGTSFYVVTAIQTDNGYIGSDALFLGDRISPQSTVSGEGNSVVVNYVDRNLEEDFGVPPSLGKSVHVLLNPETMGLGEWTADFEGESNTDGKLRADVFTGTLESVNTNGLIDPEYFVVVDGKHITTFIGMSRDTVGTVEIDDLKAHIGEQVEVYAQENEDGTYTLYGSEGFYIRLIDGSDNSSGSGQPGGTPGESYPGASDYDPGTGDEKKPQIVKDGCAVGGCSSQLCGDKDTMDDTATTCEYALEYACYQVATCERQSSGQCGWTMTPELTQCLNSM